MKKLVQQNILIPIWILVSMLILFTGTYAMAADTESVERTQFLEEMEAVNSNNEKLLAAVPMNDSATTTDTNFKAAVTFNNALSISDAETIIAKNEISVHAVYLRFVEPDGTIGTGYQLLKDGNMIDTTYIEMTEDRGNDFMGVISMEALVTPRQYRSLAADESVYIVNLGETDQSYPEDYFWDLEKLSLTKE